VSVHFPSAQAVTQLLSGLIGKNVQGKPVKPVPSLAGTAKAPTFWGLYTADGANEPSAAIVFDFPMTVSSAAAIGVIPVGVVNEQLRSGQVENLFKENVYEVLNISASLLNASGCPHLRLTAMEELRATPTGKLEPFSKAGLQRLDLEIVFPSLPPGKLSVIRLAA
jgi:hypothetical protein